jgi:hypothetical protein
LHIYITVLTFIFLNPKQCISPPLFNLPKVDRLLIQLSSILVLLFLFSTLLSAQLVEPMTCGTEDDNLPHVPTNTGCDLAYNYTTYPLIYIPVNFHFFVEDDCTGLTAAGKPADRLNQEEVFATAERILRNANNYNESISNNLQWNQAEWDAPVTAAQKVPFRYITNEVIIHCKTTSMTGASGNFWRDESLYPNAINAINAGVSNLSADGFGTFSGRWIEIENYTGQLTAHEIGHDLRLQHTHSLFEVCDDTPNFSWMYDYDNDGDYDQNAKGNPCWDSQPFLRLLVGWPVSINYNLCDIDGTVIINPSPCCELRNRDNNTMTHSLAATDADRGAMTPCQVNTMLNTILFEKCDLIGAMAPDCPPSSAVIGVLVRQD